MTSAEVREQILDSLILDLVGPVAGLKAGNYLEQEILPGSTAPLRWYLTGFLAPFAAKPEEKTDEDSGEQIDLIPPKTGLDDEAAPESASSRKTPFPSSMGLSVLIPPKCRSIKATVTWGDYAAVMKDEAATGWRRSARWAQAPLPIPAQDTTRGAVRLKDSGGLDLVLSVRTIPSHKGLDLVAPGTRAVSVFLVNNRNPMTGIRRDEAYVFQVKLQLESEVPFVTRPDLRGVISSDPDERVADLQYRDAFEYAVGHGVSARALPVIFGRRVEQYAALDSKEMQQRRDGVRGKVEDLLDDWAKISKQQKDAGATLRYQQYDDGTGPYLLRYPLDPDLERIESKAAQFKAHRSLRDVEPACNLRLIELNGNAIDPEEDLE